MKKELNGFGVAAQKGLCCELTSDVNIQVTRADGCIDRPGTDIYRN